MKHAPNNRNKGKIKRALREKGIPYKRVPAFDAPGRVWFIRGKFFNTLEEANQYFKFVEL